MRKRYRVHVSRYIHVPAETCFYVPAPTCTLSFGAKQSGVPTTGLSEARYIRDRHDLSFRLDSERLFSLRGEHEGRREADHDDQRKPHQAHPDRLLLQALPTRIALAKSVREELIGKQIITSRSGFAVRGATIAKVTSRI